MTSPVRIAIFASGAGSNARKIIDHFKEREDIAVALIVCNNPNAPIISIAAAENIPVLLINKASFNATAYINELKGYKINLIVLAGFLWQLPALLIKEYPGRIVNIHPALLPSHGGKGMYGRFVHEAVSKSGAAQTGITIHLVDEEYDHGRTLFQATCPIDREDTPLAIADKVRSLEHAHYPAIIECLIEQAL